MRTIQSRISIATGMAVVAAIAVLTAISAYSAYQTALEAASRNAMNLARLHGARVKAEIEVALHGARSLGNVLASAKTSGKQEPLSRRQVIAMLEEVTRRNPAFLGAYTAWEPGAFDGRDQEFSGTAGHDQTGRFLPYLARTAGGNVTLAPLENLEAQERGSTGLRKGEFYLCPKEGLVECVTDPYPYQIEGKTVLMTSAAVPIVIEGRFVGIAGIDIALGTLQGSTDSAELGGAADRLAIIGNNGRIVAARGRPDLAGRTAASYSSALTPEVLTGAESVIQADNDLLALAPATLGSTRTPWTLAVLTPYATAAAGAWRTAGWQVGVGLAIAAVAVLLIVLVVGRGINRLLLRVVSELSQGAAQMSAAAKQVAEASGVLAAGASEQAAALEETSASTQEINAMSASNAAGAGSAAQLVAQSQAAVEETNHKLDQMVESMAEITEANSRISQIIKDIDGIAFQTNILALNAAVEAARAGEAGMGFAVVADEVRNLAQRCASSARDTTSMVEASIRKAGEGRVRLESVVQAVRSFTEHSSQVKKIVEDVACGSHEQSRGVEEISRAVREMERGTQQVAATAEECSAASQEIEAQVGDVERIVGRLQELVGQRPATVAR